VLGVTEVHLASGRGYAVYLELSEYKVGQITILRTVPDSKSPTMSRSTFTRGFLINWAVYSVTEGV
jgi:hypothetical protein